MNGCADKATVVNAPADQTFAVGEDLYILKMNGFERSTDGTCPATPTGMPVLEFLTIEKQVNYGCLYAHFEWVGPAVTIKKTAVTGTVDAGAAVEFDVSVHNGGTYAATGYTVSDTLPSGYTWTKASGDAGCTVTSNVLNCSFDSIAIDATKTVRVHGVPDSATSCGTVNNTAVLHKTGRDDVQSSASVTVNCPVVVKRTLYVDKVILGENPDNAAVFSGTVDSAVALTWQTTNNATPFLVSDSLDPGTYHVHEGAKAGYTLKGFSVRYGTGTACPAVAESAGTEGVADLTDTNTIALVCVYNEKQTGEILISKDNSQTAPASLVGGATFLLTLGETKLCVTDGVNPAVPNAAVPECVTATWVPDEALSKVGIAKVSGVQLGTWTITEVLEPAGYGPDTCGGTRSAPLTPTAKSWTITGAGCGAWTAFHNPLLPTYQVHIAKFLDGVHATETNAGNAEFPMTAEWKDIGGGIPDGSWPYTLSKVGNGTSTPFEADTRELLAGADYKTYETLGACSPTQPYRLLGYTTSSTGFDTNPANITSTVPDFTDIQGDKYVVIWNENCFGSVIIKKVVEVGSSTNPDDPNPEFSGMFDIKPWGPLHDGDATGIIIEVPAGNNHVITEDPGTVGQPGDTLWRLVGYFAPNSAGVCPTTGGGATLDPDHISVAGGQTTTVCVLNHRNQPNEVRASVNVIKVVTGSVATTDAFDIALTTDAIGGANGTASVTGGTGHLFPIGLDTDHHDATFSVSETPRAGYTLLGYKLLVGGQGCPAPGGTYLSSVTDIPIGTSSSMAYTVCVYNEPLVTINVHKTEQNGLITTNGAGWKVTLSGCGMTPETKLTDALGNASFANKPLCATYLVSEDLTSKAPLLYFVAGGYQSSYAVNATTAGQAYSVLFANVLWSPPDFIPTPTPQTPVITPTPETPTATPETPTATVTQPVVVITPTATPTEAEAVEGEKTPGQQATPIAPETGSGGGGSGGMNIVLAGLGLAAMSIGLGSIALGKRRIR